MVSLNAGGPGIPQPMLVYATDAYVSGGATCGCNDNISGTTDDFLYQTERYGNFTYAIPVENDSYAVTLRFAETQWNTTGQRVFDVTAEGTEIVTDRDLVARAGANTSYVVISSINVSLPNVTDTEQTTATLLLDGDGLADTYERNESETDPRDQDSDAAITTANEADNGIKDGKDELDSDGLGDAVEYP